MEKLDRSKPYQEIQGESFGAKWEQNGKLFTAKGGLIYSEPAKPTQLEPEVEPEKAEAEVQPETKGPEPWEQELLDKLDDYMSRPEIIHALDKLGEDYSKFWPTAKLLEILKAKLMEEYGDR